MTRMSAERIRELEALRRDNREACHWGHVGDLLEELAAVTRERDTFEAQRNHSRRSFASLKLVADKITDQLFATEKERDALRAENARLRAVVEVFLQWEMRDSGKDIPYFKRMFRAALEGK